MKSEDRPLMTSTEALEWARETKRAWESTGLGDEETFMLAVDMFNAFKILDNLLTNGEPLPEDWRHNSGP